MKVRKKPVVVDAIVWDGDNEGAVADFLGLSKGEMVYVGKHVSIQTLEGLMAAAPGDWIIKGVAGEFYPCKPDIFDKTYDRAFAAEDAVATQEH